MGTVTRRLNALWARQTPSSVVLPRRSDQFAAGMFVKLKEPLRIGSRALPPGRYVLRPSDPSGDRNGSRVLDEDQTELLATFSPAFDN